MLRSRRLQQLRHDLVAAMGWLVIAWAWWRVLRATDLRLLGLSSGLVLAVFVVNALVTVAWIRHNLRIFRRKGPRTGVPSAVLDYRRDWTGRPVEADWPRVRSASVVTVTIDDGRKQFVAVRAADGASGS